MGRSPDPLGRLESLLNPPRYLSQSEFGLREIAEGLTLVHAGELTAGAVKMESGVQFIVNVVASLVALIGSSRPHGCLARRAPLLPGPVGRCFSATSGLSSAPTRTCLVRRGSFFRQFRSFSA